jgi:hypothetical protein
MYKHTQGEKDTSFSNHATDLITSHASTIPVLDRLHEVLYETIEDRVPFPLTIWPLLPGFSL